MERMQARGVATTHLKEYLRKLVKAVEALRVEIGKIEKRLSKMADKRTPDHRPPETDSGCSESNSGHPGSIDAGPSSNAGHPSSDPSSNATHPCSMDVDPSSSTGHVPPVDANSDSNAGHPISVAASPNSDSGHPNESDSTVEDPASQFNEGPQSSQDTGCGERSTTEHQEQTSPPHPQSTTGETVLDDSKAVGVQDHGLGEGIGTSEVEVTTATHVQHCCTSSDEGPSPQDHEQ